MHRAIGSTLVGRRILRGGSEYTPQPFSPLDLDPISFYRADYGVILTSGKVSQFNDATLNGWYMEQTSSGNRPQQIDVTISGGNRKGIKFTKANSEYLRAFESRNFGTTTKFFFAVVKLEVTDSTGQFYDIGNDAGTACVWADTRSRLGTFVQVGQSIDNTGHSGEVHFIAAEFQASGTKYYSSWIDNNAMFTTEVPQTGTVESAERPTMGCVWNNTVPGPFQFVDGTVLECGFWDRSLTTIERTRLFNYAKGRYNISAATPWSPKDLSPETWCLSTNGITTVSSHVSYWADLSGNGWDFQQTSSGNRPTLSNAFGFQTIHCTAANSEYLKSISAKTFASGSGFFWCVRSVQTGGSNNQGVFFQKENGKLEIKQNNAGGVLRARLGSTDVDDGATNSENVLLAATVEYVQPSGTTTAYKNNVSFGTATIGAGDGEASDFLSVGARDDGSAAANMDIFEIGFVSRTLTSSEKTKLQQYFHARYNI